MIKYIIRRMLLMLPVMMGVTIIVFTLMYITPGDPVDTLLSGEAQAVSEETREALREELGLNGTYFERLVRYVKGLLTGDMGFDYNTRVPVLTRIKETFPNTIKLALTGIIFAVIFGVSLGVFAAVKQNTIWDTIASIIALLGNAMPNFWVALLLMLLFSYHLNVLPSIGYDSWKHMILPMIVVGTSSMAAIARMTRSSMLEVIRADYITTARSKGLKESAVILIHALPNALIPVLTTIGIQFGHLLGGSVLTETVFAIPGMGSMMIKAIGERNHHVVQGSVLLAALTLSVLNLLIDLLYAFVDPRIRSEYM